MKSLGQDLWKAIEYDSYERKVENLSPYKGSIALHIAVIGSYCHLIILGNKAEISGNTVKLATINKSLPLNGSVYTLIIPIVRLISITQPSVHG